MPRKRKPVLSTSGDKGPALAQRLCVQGTLDKRGAEVLVRQLRSTYSEDAAPHPRRTLDVVVAHGLSWLSCPSASGLFLDQVSTYVPCIGRRILNYWTTREVPHFFI